MNEPDPLPPTLSIREKRSFILRVYWVKRNDEEGDWEVRADTGKGLVGSMCSLFYHESDPTNLPRLDELIDVEVSGIIS